MKNAITKLTVLINDYLEPIRIWTNVHTSSAKMGPKLDTIQKI